MSREQRAQSLDASVVEPPRAQDLPPRPLESYPERLFIEDMAAIFRVGVKRAYRMAADGDFDHLRERPSTGGRLAFSRRLVVQHFEGRLRGLTVARKRT